MSGGFRRRRHRGGIAVTFEPLEVALLRQFFGEMSSLLEAEAGGSPPNGSDVLGDHTDLADHSDLADLADLNAVETMADFEELTAEVAAPDDPVLRRLLPDAYVDDPEASSDFRRFTQDSLLARKIAAAQTVLASLAGPPDDPSATKRGDSADLAVAVVVAAGAGAGEPDDTHEIDAMDVDPAALLSETALEVALTDDEARAWLAALNDVRLALGVRLGVEQDDDEMWAALPDTDPRATIHEIYAWLGWLQETLVRALS